VKRKSGVPVARVQHELGVRLRVFGPYYWYDMAPDYERDLHAIDHDTRQGPLAASDFRQRLSTARTTCRASVHFSARTEYFPSTADAPSRVSLLARQPHPRGKTGHSSVREQKMVWGWDGR